jgi:hypothetical protein
MFGAGALITKAFVSKAVAYAGRTSRPLLVPPDTVERDLFLYQDDGLISLGEFQVVMEVPVPTWRQFFELSVGRPIETAADIELVACMDDLREEDLDEEMDGYTWESAWEYRFSPTARAFELLEGLDLGDLKRQPGRTAWRKPLEFVEGGFHPGDDSRVVLAEDPVTASLLQARLIELRTGLQLVPSWY